jgi:hypothetical protein
MIEIQKAIPESQHLSVLKSNVDTINLNPEIKQEDITSANNEPSLSCHRNENEMPDYCFQSDSSYRTFIFDTKGLF